MKLSSILSTLALGLGLASATGIEQEATLKSALRGRIEEASPFFKKPEVKTEWVTCHTLTDDPRKVLVRLHFKHASYSFFKSFFVSLEL